METGSPAWKSTRKVTGATQKKKNSLAWVSQQNKESEDSGDSSESSTSSSIAQKQESSKQKSPLEVKRAATANRTFIVVRHCCQMVARKVKA
jgi:hypothetical protein